MKCPISDISNLCYILSIKCCFMKCRFNELSFYEMLFYEISFYNMLFYKMSFYGMSFYEMSFYEILFYEMPFYEMSFYEMSFYEMPQRPYFHKKPELFITTCKVIIFNLKYHKFSGTKYDKINVGILYFYKENSSIAKFI